MGGITLAIAQAKLNILLDKYESIAGSREFSHTGSQVAFSKQNHELDKINDSIEYWDQKVQDLTPGNQGLIISQIAPE